MCLVLSPIEFSFAIHPKKMVAILCPLLQQKPYPPLPLYQYKSCPGLSFSFKPLMGRVILDHQKYKRWVTISRVEKSRSSLVGKRRGELPQSFGMKWIPQVL